MNKYIPSGIELQTQNRVIKLMTQELGYKYLGNWKDRDNSSVEIDILKKWMSEKMNYASHVIESAVRQFTTAVNKKGNLYDINKDVYNLLRYGVNVNPGNGETNKDIYLIDWANFSNNDFAIAEEVTVKGAKTKRPDIVIYVNGIALGVIELKRSKVSISEGIHQNLDNQKSIFIKPFFHTMQLVMAGNDTEGLRYGTIETSEKFYLKWKEVSEERDAALPHLLEITKYIRENATKQDLILDKHIVELLNKERFLEIIHDFTVYDRGIKKLCRPNQYFGIRSAQDFVTRKEGGIIWHTQGSGKSLTMVWLTKWIRSNNPDARVLIITDRDELDEQIEKVFVGVSEAIYRTKSGADLIHKLNGSSPNEPSLPTLMCSLIHKFGKRNGDKEQEASEQDIKTYIDELRKAMPQGYKAKGDIYVLVDECHRTQSGRLHEAMKFFVPNALFIGFTGTPLLKSDKAKSKDVFGRYIHTYKFNEAVADKVILDLQYEARDVEQNITSEAKIDEWFELKTKGLTEYAKEELKSRWGTIKKIFSSKSRLEKIVMDIVMDMEKKDRLQSGRGNAMLVADSIYNACRYYELFQKAGLKKCAIITSYEPNYSDIKGEETGEGQTEKLLRFEIYRKMLADYFEEPADEAAKKIDEFEKLVKKKFTDEPSQMKLLIVVNKLLTGFDAPPATYLYIDKSLRDHGLFQAVCRVNRLDGEDKDYGYIIDYKDLFKSLEKAYADFTKDELALGGYDEDDVHGLLSNRFEKGKERLDNALEAIKSLVEAVDAPYSLPKYIKYFCGNPEVEEELSETRTRRESYYKLAISLLRAYTSIADEMDKAGYSREQSVNIAKEVRFFEGRREEIMLASGDYIDLKQYEPAMRFLIDSYVGAIDSRVLASFDNVSLVELLDQKGDSAIDTLPENIKKDKEAMAEVIENNVRKVIIERNPENTQYFEKMSKLLAELIAKRKAQTIEYEEYLKEIIELSKQVVNDGSNEFPAVINTTGKRKLYQILDQKTEVIIAVDGAVHNNKSDGWRNNKMKRRAVKNHIIAILKEYNITDIDKVDRVFECIEECYEY